MTSVISKKIIDYLNDRKALGEFLYLEPDVIKSFEHIDYGINSKTEIPENSDNGNEYKKEEERIIEPIDMSVNIHWRNSGTLDELYNNINSCLRCPLGSTRTNFVFGSGNPHADILVIGEAPGAEEDAQGLPFVGKAGQLLTKIIESIDLKREDVYICNICKCRPPSNRAPFASEVEACLPYLLKQIDIIKPKFILALGATAVASLTGKKPIMSDVRGKLTDFYGVKMLITYHPAALLYNPNLKRDVWEDMKLLRKLYNESIQNKEVI